MTSIEQICDNLYISRKLTSKPWDVLFDQNEDEKDDYFRLTRYKVIIFSRNIQIRHVRIIFERIERNSEKEMKQGGDGNRFSFSLARRHQLEIAYGGVLPLKKKIN